MNRGHVLGSDKTTAKSYLPDLVFGGHNSVIGKSTTVVRNLVNLEYEELKISCL